MARYELDQFDEERMHDFYAHICITHSQRVGE